MVITMVTLTDNPIGIYEKAIPNEFDWAQKIDIAKRAGYDFIEISIDESDERLNRLNWSKVERQRLKAILVEQNFEIRSMCLSGHRRYPFGSADSAKRQRAYQIVEQAFVLSADLGIKNIQLAGYDVYYEPSDDATIARFIDGLKYTAKLAEKYNVMTSIEIMDTALCGTLSRAIQFVNAVQSPYLKLYPDLGNLYQWTEQPVTEIKEYFSHIVAIHLKDTKPNVFKCVPFGEGTVNFEAYFQALEELNYAGPFLVEMWAQKTEQPNERGCVAHLKQARQWLQERM